MSEDEAQESRQSFRARHYTLGAFSNQELTELIYGLRAIHKPENHPLLAELKEELSIRYMEEGQRRPI